ncbi:ABC transporter permease [Streptomyces tuirus]|uniref:ABC transporter permease n=1 Tax=Streptomyces tuirus TaxID=68278 RepID=A0A941FL01_9ACTN|nr:ABC transporter permease [Streptomyces tuirus]
MTALRVLRSEWSKFWSVRSSWITLALSVTVLAVIGALASAAYTPDTGGGNAPPLADGAVGLALTGTTFAALGVGVLGVLFSAGEYSTGMIRSTLAAVPKRLPVLWSKSLVYGVVATVVTAAGALAAFQLGGLTLKDADIALSLGDEGVPRALAGAGIYLGLVGMWGVALGALLRSIAGGIAALTGTLLIVPGLASLLPDSVADALTPLLPSKAGEALTALEHSAGLLSPDAGLAALVGWVAVTLAAAGLRLTRTDA